jgi:hypothetical protein
MLEDLESTYIPPTRSASDDKESTSSDGLTFEFEGLENDIGGQRADSMRFPSRAHVVFGEEDQPWKLVEIIYYVEEDEKTNSLTLFRSERNLLEEREEGAKNGLPLCENLTSVAFKYVNNEGDEQDEWDNTDEGIPWRVSVSLGFVNPSNPEAPLEFATSIALLAQGEERPEEE